MITCLGLLASAQEVSKFKIYKPTAGGIDPKPIITSFTSTQGLTIKVGEDKVKAELGVQALQPA